MKISSKFLHTGIAIGMLFLTRLLPAGEAPPFLVVGQSYNVILVNNAYQFRVLEIGKEGWIKVDLRQQNTVRVDQHQCGAGDWPLSRPTAEIRRLSILHAETIRPRRVWRQSPS